MAVVAPSSPGGLEPKSEKSGEDNAPAAPQDPPSLSSPAASDPTAPSAAAESTAAAPENPNPIPMSSTPNAPVVPPRPPSVPSFTPSFRPIGAPHVPQFTPLANPNLANSSYQVPGLQPPGVSAPGAPLMHPPGVYHPPSGQMQPAPPGSYMAPNGYMPIPPPGVHRYPGPYHPGFPMPPGAPMGAIPSIHRPPIHGIRGIPPLISSITRPAIPFIAPSEKPQTTVYVGKIASTVGNDFIESVLRLCGPVKSWKRAENPSDGTFRGFGFCEFESAEGVLRALRLLNKLNMDGQELVLNVNQATREYLERYVEKKKEREKLKEAEEDASQSGSEKQEPRKPVDEKPGASEESDYKEKEDNSRKFGIVSDEDRDADKDALDKLTNMIHERMKSQPPPPPPSEAAALASKSTSEAVSKSTDVDIIKTDSSGDKDEEMMGDTKDHDRHETSPSERTRRVERSVERDRDKDLKREKEREIERFERGRERERVRREREREMKIREIERLYKELLKDWEAREREKEIQRHRELEREKEKARERRREIKDQEIESDEEDTRKRRHRSSTLEEKRRKRQREKEEDLADVLREEEEIKEAMKREKEEQKLKEESELENGGNTTALPEDHMLVEDHQEKISVNEDNHHADEESPGNGDNAEPKQENNAPSRKLGFGLMASGKRAAVLSVFHQEDEGVEEKKMRPLVPIDYSAEEMQATPPGTVDAPPHLAAAAEFAKRISGPSHNRRDVHREKPHRGREDEENKKLVDAKQLIDMIPKTKDKLFAYQINWDIYDKHGLHERMRPWISKKITEFLGEEETTLVDYIVSSTREHVHASQMLEMLQSILDDEAEMFVLKMWRMLIFEIKKVETGLALKTK